MLQGGSGALVRNFAFGIALASMVNVADAATELLRAKRQGKTGVWNSGLFRTR